MVGVSGPRHCGMLCISAPSRITQSGGFPRGEGNGIFHYFCQFLLDLLLPQCIVNVCSAYFACDVLIVLLEFARHICVTCGFFHFVITNHVTVMLMSLVKSRSISFDPLVCARKDYDNGNGHMLMNCMVHCEHSTQPQPSCQFRLLQCTPWIHLLSNQYFWAQKAKVIGNGSGTNASSSTSTSI